MNKDYSKTLEAYSKYDYDWSFLENKKILISGATGLIGRFLIDLIMYKNINDNLNCTIVGLCRNTKKANEVFSDYIDNPNLIIYQQDVSEKITYSEPVDFVIHAASNTHPIQYAVDPIGTIKTNVYGTNNLLCYCKEKDVRKFILLSSFEVYGTVSDVDRISEDDYGVVDISRVRSCYPESKRLSENLSIAYASQENINVSIVRLSRVFGPTMMLSSSLATAQFIKNSLNNEDIVLKSSGDQLYSYNYVGDAVTAILTVLKDGVNGKAYNVSDESYDLTLKEFATMIANINNRKVIHDLPSDVEKKGFSNSVMTILDSTELKKLGWKPLRDIETDLKDTMKILKLGN